MIVFGLISTVFDLLTFALLLEVFDAGEAVFQTAWFVVSLLTELAVVLVLRTRGPLWRSRPSALLLWVHRGGGAGPLALPYVPAAAGAVRLRARCRLRCWPSWGRSCWPICCVPSGSSGGWAPPEAAPRRHDRRRQLRRSASPISVRPVSTRPSAAIAAPRSSALLKSSPPS